MRETLRSPVCQERKAAAKIIVQEIPIGAVRSSDAWLERTRCAAVCDGWCWKRSIAVFSDRRQARRDAIGAFRNGRFTGLKILGPETVVRVRFPPPALRLASRVLAPVARNGHSTIAASRLGLRERFPPPAPLFQETRSLQR